MKKRIQVIVLGLLVVCGFATQAMDVTNLVIGVASGYAALGKLGGADSPGVTLVVKGRSPTVLAGKIAEAPIVQAANNPGIRFDFADGVFEKAPLVLCQLQHGKDLRLEVSGLEKLRRNLEGTKSIPLIHTTCNSGLLWMRRNPEVLSRANAALPDGVELVAKSEGGCDDLYLRVRLDDGLTLLRMGRMPVAPKVDGVITMEERENASANYGLISEKTRLMSLRYAVTYFGYTDGGFYCAARVSRPPSPMQYGDGDRVRLELKRPGAAEPFGVSVSLAKGSADVPGVLAAMRSLKGIADFGVECVEVEMFVPYAAAGLPCPRDGERWGLQMSVDFSSPAETAYWHMPRPSVGKYGVFIPDSAMPVAGLQRFGHLEDWRATANCRFEFSFTGCGERKVPLASETMLHYGVGYSKLDGNPEKASEFRHASVGIGRDAVAEPGKTFTPTRWVVNLWPGTVNILDVDFAAGGKTVMKRRLAWDLSRGEKWRDCEGLPKIRTGFYPSHGNRLRVEYKVNNARDIVRAALRVIDKDGKVHFERSLCNGSPLEDGIVDERLADLPLGSYRVRFAAEGKNGRRYRDETTFDVRKFPWQDESLGREDVVIPPFRPISVKGDRVNFTLTGYGCGGVLWNAVYAKDENILASPVRLSLNGEEFRVANARVVEQKDTRYIRELACVHPALRDLALRVTQDYDYDGFCRVALAFDAARSVAVESLRIEIPVKDSAVSLYDVVWRNDNRSRAAPDFTIPRGEGKIWDSADRHRLLNSGIYPAPFQPYVWVGGVEKGFSWITDSINGWSLDPQSPAQFMTRKGGVLVLTVDIVNKPVVWEGRRTLTMGFQPTPVKASDWHMAREAQCMYAYDRPTNAVGTYMCGLMEPTQVLYPYHQFPGDDVSLVKWILTTTNHCDKVTFDRLAKEYERKHADWFRKKGIVASAFTHVHSAEFLGTGAKYKSCYYDPHLISCFWPEWEMYKAEWSRGEFPDENFYSEYCGFLSPSRIDKMLSDALAGLKLGYDGIYYDCFATYIDSNDVVKPGRSFRRPDGTIQQSACGLLDWRELLRRTAVMSFVNGKFNCGRPFVDLHTTDHMVNPVVGWCSDIVTTERGVAGGDFQDRFPEGFTLAEIVGRQSGVHSRIIVSTTVGDNARKERELKSLMGWMCAYGIFHIHDQGLLGRPFFAQAWNVPFDYGWGTDGVRPHFYYDDTPAPVTHTGRDVRLTVAEKVDGSGLLLMFGNLGDATEFSFRKVGKPAAARCVDALTGEAVDPMRVAVEKHGYRMIFVKNDNKKE